MSVLMDLIVTFMKIGAFSFGGGYAMIPFIQEEVVVLHGWISKGRLLDLIAVSQSTPGPIAINLATFVGYGQMGFWGSLGATVAVSIPSFIMACALWRLKQKGSGVPWLEAMFKGIRPAAVGLIAGVCITMGTDAVKTPFQLCIMLTVFILSVRLKVRTGPVLILSAVLGVVASYAGWMGGA